MRWEAVPVAAALYVHLRLSYSLSPTQRIPHDQNATIIPTLRYHDATAAIEWLCRAFGFEKHAVDPGEGGTIEHAQLVLGDGMMMVGSVRDDELRR